MMIRNEKGFTYPLTFCIILLLSMFITLYLEQFLAEKKLNIESETIFKQEYYFLSAVKHVESEILKIEDSEFPIGSLYFSNGNVEYRTEELTESLLKVTFDLQIENIPIVSGIGYYDKEIGKMIKWIEKN